MEDTNDDGRYSEEVKLREETYQRKLQENIELKQAFYDNGVRNYNDFKSSKELEESDDDEIINLKRETIALYDSLKKLAFRPERDDLIGISLADYKLDKQVKGLKKETDGIKNYNASLLNRINCTSALIKNFESIGESLDLRITKEELKTTQVNDISVKFKIKDLEKKISIQKQRELQLMKYSKQVIYKYLIELNFSDLNDDTIKNKTILKKKILL
ncbi:hypothetical protein PACTADRAFT_82240 [Pachysolen tannophilus NRRL Y-2460]|uniref:Uncharacterized protein n=1 Tax=Pachysolen tannophilus NRRL Y-2460 TaxID=669874 RepID=A0A1E4TPQ9_PACTA|nr:hypothetical protein PACTADRAFT_82240 [Pachysolen tannophilus NRRL Y-2460]